MMSLRQRLLLVAGWAVAAVATGLVSAGAVAVAGGQVTDRPLRPLSAAEVAALPVTVEDPCATSEPLASGGSASLDGCFARESSCGPATPGDDTARPAQKELLEPSAADPSDLGLVETGDTESSAFPEDAEIPQVGPRQPEPEVIDVIGGRVSLSVVDNALVLNAATPRAGFVADLQVDRPDQLTISFWNGEHLSTVSATLTDSGLAVATTEDGG